MAIDIHVFKPVGRYYRARGRAQNVIGYGQWSAWSTPTIVLVLPDSPRSISTAASGPVGMETDFRISWTRPSETGSGSSEWPLLSYEITLAAQNVTSIIGRVCNVKSDPFVTNGTSLAIVVPTLTSKCSYQIAVRARNSIGWGPSTHRLLVVKVINHFCLCVLERNKCLACSG